VGIPLSGSAAITAAAMLDAAALIEQAGIGGLLISCHHDRVAIQVGPHDGEVAARAGLVAALAAMIGASPVQRHSQTTAQAWLEAAGQAGAARIEVYTPLAVRSAPGGAGTLALAPGAQVSAVAAGQPLPPGWRWVTELDQAPDGQGAPA
jgi:hypothetical protein